MRSLAQIQELVRQRHGNDALENLPAPADTEALQALADDRCLAEMTRRIFQVGFSWKVIDKKWPGFEQAFHGFEPGRLALMHEDDYRPLMQDTGIVRNWHKITTVPRNARMVWQIADEFDSFGHWLAQWPSSDIVGLWDALKTRGSRLGGMTGPLVLRTLGKDTFMLSRDVVARLAAEDVFQGRPEGKRARQDIQAAFLAWQQESGLALAQISRLLALSIDAG